MDLHDPVAKLGKSSKKDVIWNTSDKYLWTNNKN